MTQRRKINFKDICGICGKEIQIMIFRGTKLCSVDCRKVSERVSEK